MGTTILTGQLVIIDHEEKTLTFEINDVISQYESYTIILTDDYNKLLTNNNIINHENISKLSSRRGYINSLSGNEN